MANLRRVAPSARRGLADLLVPKLGATAFDEIASAGFFGVASAPAVSGSAAVVQAAQTGGGTGVERFAGSASGIQGTQTESGVGKERFAAAGSVTQAGQAESVTGAEKFRGAASPVQAGQTTAATAEQEFEGPVVQAQSGQQQGVAAWTGCRGSVSTAQAPQGVVIQAAERFLAAGAASQPAQTASAAGATEGGQAEPVPSAFGGGSVRKAAAPARFSAVCEQRQFVQVERGAGRLVVAGDVVSDQRLQAAAGSGRRVFRTEEDAIAFALAVARRRRAA